jgi:hypothetical protein
MSNVSPGSEDQQKEGRDAVAVVVEALGVLQTRDGFDLPTELVEERARNVVTALRGEFAIAKIGPIGLGEALAHLDAASAILVALEGKV